MSKKADLALVVLDKLAGMHPDARTELEFSNPLEMLVATILSAQCTDERVNKVTRDLFEKYQTAQDYADADQAELEEDIRPTGFFRNKAKSIISCCNDIVSEHEGNVPDTMDELVALHGVGRKTASVVLGEAFGTPAIAVDTHVGRVSRRLGWTKQKNADKVELDLRKLLPEDRWIESTRVLIFHGRYCCKSRKPQCWRCDVFDECRFEDKQKLAEEGK